MALINCSECKKEISNMATSCPNCGAPLVTNNLVLNEKQIENENQNRVNSKAETGQEIKESLIVRFIVSVFNWLFGVLFLISGITSALNGKIIISLIMVSISFLLLPPIRNLVYRKTNKRIPTVVRIVLVISLFALLDMQTKKLDEEKRKIAEKLAVEEQKIKAEKEEKLRQELTEDFNKNRDQVLSEANEFLINGEFDKAISITSKYLLIKNTDLINISNKAILESKKAKELKALELKASEEKIKLEEKKAREAEELNKFSVSITKAYQEKDYKKTKELIKLLHSRFPESSNDFEYQVILLEIETIEKENLKAEAEKAASILALKTEKRVSELKEQLGKVGTVKGCYEIYKELSKLKPLEQEYSDKFKEFERRKIQQEENDKIIEKANALRAQRNAAGEWDENETVSVGYTSYLVSQSKWVKKLSDNKFLNQKADANFLVVEVTVRNDDTKPRVIPPFLLIDENGSEYEVSSKGYLIEGSLGVLDSLNPSVKKQGFIVFDVPKNRKFKLKISGGYWSSKNAFILLDPK